MYWHESGTNILIYLTAKKTNKYISQNLNLNFKQVSRCHIVWLNIFYTDCVVIIGHCRRMNKIENWQGNFLPSCFQHWLSLGIFYRVQIKFLLHPSVWEHDKAGYNKRGNCGRPDCLPQWTQVSDTKLKDRIVEKIRIEIRGCLLQIELGQQTLPLSHLTKITPLLLPCMYPCLSIPFLEEFNMHWICVTYGRTLLNQIQHPPLRSWIFTCWISSRSSLEKCFLFFLESALRTALRLFSCADSGFWLRPEILSSIWDKSRPGGLSKNLSLLGV